jgi:hypothetical protein
MATAGVVTAGVVTAPPQFYSSNGIINMNKAISKSYFLLGLFTILAALFTYFIYKLVMSITNVYNDYLFMNSQLENQRNTIKIPGITDNDDDDIDYSNPLADRYDADKMNLTDNIEERIDILDDDVVNKTNGKMKNLINLRQNNSKNNGTPYKYSAYIGNSVISPDFDDYVYAPPNNTEKSFFEYLFSP